MVIKKDTLFVVQLKKILIYIAKDKRTAAVKFESELNKKILLLPDNPYLFRQSHYFDSNLYRDLIYSGYTVIYKVDGVDILILEIFKWQEKW